MAMRKEEQDGDCSKKKLCIEAEKFIERLTELNEMLDLVKDIKETHKERNWKEHEGNQQQPTQPKTLLLQSSTETRNSYDPATIILQFSQQNIFPPGTERLSSPPQSYDERNNIQEINTSANEHKISIKAALWTLLMYFCSLFMVIDGAIHRKDCPAQNMIPISCIILGSLFLFLLMINNPQDYQDILNKDWNTAFNPQIRFNFIINIAIICFYFALCYWTFHITPDTIEGSPNYCEENFYKDTYRFCTLNLYLFGLWIVLKCCGF